MKLHNCKYYSYLNEPKCSVCQTSYGLIENNPKISSRFEEFRKLIIESLKDLLTTNQEKKE